MVHPLSASCYVQESVHRRAGRRFTISGVYYTDQYEVCRVNVEAELACYLARYDETRAQFVVVELGIVMCVTSSLIAIV